ncbi:hypothetical protein U1Q18_014995 [Sarracenia purpurea var. burkii]
MAGKGKPRQDSLGRDSPATRTEAAVASRDDGCGEAPATPAWRMQAHRARRTSGKQTAETEAGAAPKRREEAGPASTGRRPGAAASAVG